MGIAYHTGNSALGGKNHLINSNGLVNQRAYVSGTATTVANQYTVDRWRVVTLGQNLTFTTTNGVTTFTAPAGGVEQVIENLNVLGGSYVLTIGGTAAAVVAESTDNVTYTTLTPTNGIYTVTGGKYVKVTFSGGTFSLPQFERGTIATPYSLLDIEVEIAKCQRYLPVIENNEALMGQCVSATNAYIVFPFKVTTKTQPNGISTVVGGTLRAANGGSINITAITFLDATVGSIRINIGVASGLVAGDATNVLPSKILITGCEL